MLKSHCKKIALLLLFFVFLNILCTIPVSAATISVTGESGKTIDVEDLNNDGKINYDEMNIYAKNELNMLGYGIFKLVSWSRVNGTGLILDTLEPFFNSSEYKNGRMGAIIYEISASIQIVGRLLCLLYFFLSLIELSTNDNFTLETFIKHLAKLAILFVIFSPSTITILSDFASALENTLLNSVTESSSFQFGALVDCIFDIKQFNLKGALGLVFGDSIFSLTTLLSIIVVEVVSFGRAIELIIYESLLPLGMSSIYNGGLNSSGFRYIKKWIALYIQGAIMFLATILGYLVSTNISFFGNNGFGEIACALAVAAVIARSKSIANDIMGV